MNVTRTHPVFLLSCTLAIVGWLITLAGLCASRGEIQPIYWCTVAFEFGLLVFVCAVVFTNNLPKYYPTILSLIVLGMPYGIDEIKYHLMIGQPALSASAAGFIVLMTAKFSWLFLFGIQPNLNEFYSFKDYHSCTSTNNQSYDTVVVNPVVEIHKPHYNLPVSAQASYPRTMYSHEAQGVVPIYHSNPDVCHLMETARCNPDDMNQLFSLSGPVEYDIPVVAIHKYVADPKDPDELSFEKGERLNIRGQEGNWWKAQKADGRLGMVPSNYVTMLSD